MNERIPIAGSQRLPERGLFPALRELLAPGYCRCGEGDHCVLNSLHSHASCSASIEQTVLGLVVSAVVLSAAALSAAEPPTIDPFGPPTSEGQARTRRRRARLPRTLRRLGPSGMIYLTRDKRLKIYDERLQRQREVPLQAVKQIECKVKKEWMEKEWKFKETTSDEKIFTGRSYPTREYLHTITLRRRPHDHRPVGGDRLRSPLAASRDDRSGFC